MKKLMPVFGLVMLATLMSACGEYETPVYADIEPDETAFMIPLEGSNETATEGSVQFQSEEYLQSNKVAAKRVRIPQRESSTGRMWFSYEYIPTHMIVKIKRAPVAREWTEDPNTGTSNSYQRIDVESLDSVGFSLGATIRCSIEEDDAAKFLYRYGGKQLEAIIDTDIRNYIASKLSQVFGNLKLEDCKNQKGVIFDQVFETTKERFKLDGITVDSFGLSGGLLYDDPKIQDAINDQVKASASIETQRQNNLARDEANAQLKRDALAELEAARIRFQIQIEEAEAKSDAALKLSDNKEALLLETEIYERKKAADAKVEAAKSLKDVRILPAGSGLLFGLDDKKK